MIAYGDNIKVFCGNSNPAFAQTICKELGIKLGQSTVRTFADGEASVSLEETVRGADVFLVQSTCKPVNDHLMELLVMIDACRRASAGRITAVIPYFGYARQDRKAKSRDPISAKLVANMITAAGADRILTMDLHAAQIQGFFDIPVDHLLGNPTFVKYYLDKFPEDKFNHDDFVVVSPDVGSVARARAFAAKVHMGLAIVDKRRQKANVCEVMNVIGDVEGKTCILYDDMVDTAGSLCNAANALVVPLQNIPAELLPGTDTTGYKDKLAAIKGVISANLQKITEKMAEPASVVELETVAPILQELSASG